MKKRIISISISESLYQKIKEQADKVGLSVSAYITLLVQGEKKL